MSNNWWRRKWIDLQWSWAGTWFRGLLTTCFEGLMWASLGIVGFVLAVIVCPFFLFFFVPCYCHSHGKAILWCVYQWLNENVAITFICTLAGLLLYIVGGANGAAMGATIGFLLGICIEITRWTNNVICNNDDGYQYSPPKGDNSIFKAQVYEKPYEKPWTWKGFQVSQGPREDSVLRELETKQ